MSLDLPYFKFSGVIQMKSFFKPLWFLSSLVSIASADVIFTDIANITATNQTNIAVDVNQDGIDDLAFTNTTSTGRGSVAGLNGAAVLGLNGITNADRLDFGETIFSGSWNNSYGAALSGSGKIWNVIIGDKFLGVRLNIAGELHYGWVTLNGSSNGQSLIITEVAFNDEPNAPIYAGEKSTRPELSLNSGNTLLKGSNYVISSDSVSITDVDNTAAEVIVDVTVNPTSGQIAYLSAPETAITSFSTQDLIDGQVIYQHDGGTSTSDSITISFTDSISSPVSGVINFNIVSDMQGPLLETNVEGSLEEGDTLVLSSAILSASDDFNDATGIHYVITNYPNYGKVINLATDPNVNITHFTQAEVESSNVVYVHNGSDSITDKIGFYLEDASGNQSSSADFEIAITPVDDEQPTVVNNRVLILNSGDSALFKAEALAAEDDLSDASNVTFNITSAPSEGTIEVGSSTVSSFTQEDINSGALIYKNANSTGVTVDSVSFTVSDSSGNTTEPYTFLIYVFDVNDVSNINQIGLAPLSMNVFPNPTSDFIQIEGLTAGQTVEIYSADGQIQQASRNGSLFDVQNLGQGNYLVLVKSQSNQLEGKSQFLKQ